MNKRERPGLSIPIIEISEEESKLDITIDRIRNYHGEVGEDFLEYESNELINCDVFGGFLIAKLPHLSKEIIFILNDSFRSSYEFSALFDCSEETHTLYHYLCEFANLTINTKRKINEVLISVEKYYN